MSLSKLYLSIKNSLVVEKLLKDNENRSDLTYDQCFIIRFWISNVFSVSPDTSEILACFIVDDIGMYIISFLMEIANRRTLH